MTHKYNKLTYLSPIFVIALLSGCSGGSDTTTPPADISADVTLVDGYIKDANITDTNGVQATEINGTIGLYRFSIAPTYPIKMIVGNAKFTDTNTTFDINLTAYSGTVISPITTIIGNDTTIQNNLLATMNIPSGTLLRDYVDANDTDVAKLSQLCYAMLKDTNATTKFKTRTENNITALIDKAITEDSNTSANQDGIVNFLTTLKTHSGSVKDFERDLQAKKAIIGSKIVWKGLAYDTITSSVTNKVWLDRNLGANGVCTSSTDTACYGDYYQWGRDADGHQVSNSTTSSTLATDLNTTGNSSFITSGSSPYDWTALDSNGALRSANWSKTDGSSVCPVGYRVPTIEELLAETISNSADAYTKLKLPSAGYRHGDSGLLVGQGSAGSVRLSFSDDQLPLILFFNSTEAGYFQGIPRTYGMSVRCVEDFPTFERGFSTSWLEGKTLYDVYQNNLGGDNWGSIEATTMKFENGKLHIAGGISTDYILVYDYTITGNGIITYYDDVNYFNEPGFVAKHRYIHFNSYNSNGFMEVCYGPDLDGVSSCTADRLNHEVLFLDNTKATNAFGNADFFDYIPAP